METKMTDEQRFGRIAVISDQINDLKEKISDLEEERDALSLTAFLWARTQPENGGWT